MKIAMILAAGRGERLKPFTKYHPKALYKIKGIPLIEHHVQRLVSAGFQRIVINHAYLGDQIRKQLGFGQRFGVDICYLTEPPGGLETGGGIFNALPWFENQPFITVNADIFTDYNFETLSLPTNSLLHLVLVPKPIYAQQGDFHLSDNHQLNNAPKQFTAAGITYYHPHAFAGQTVGRYSVASLWRRLATEQKATGEIYLGQWMDIGQPSNGIKPSKNLELSF